MASTAVSTILKLATPQLQDHVASCQGELNNRKKALEEEKASLLNDIKLNNAFLKDSLKQRDSTKKELATMADGGLDEEVSIEDIEEKQSDLLDYDATIADALAKQAELKERLKEIDEQLTTVEDYDESAPASAPEAPKAETKAQKRKRELEEAYEAMTEEERELHDEAEQQTKADAKQRRKDDKDEQSRKLKDYDNLTSKYGELENDFDELENEFGALKKRKNTMNRDLNYLKNENAKAKALVDSQLVDFEEFLVAQDDPEVLMAKFTEWKKASSDDEDEELVID